jgi:phosphomannomutase
MLQILTEDPRPLSKLIKPLRKYWQSGEINFRMPSDEQKQQVIARVEEKFQGKEQFKLDGLSVIDKKWQFNVRFSNTEPVVRLTAESFEGGSQMQKLVHEVESVITGLGGIRLTR